MIQKYILLLSIIALYACNSKTNNTNTGDTKATYADVQVVGAMKNVMWKGELGPRIKLDTITPQKGLYGLGPLSYLAGELLINDGVTYVSKVTSDTTMTVEKKTGATAPFFVYTHVNEWHEVALGPEVKSVKDIEQLVDKKTKDFKRPFAFKLIGSVSKADIHIQNLPKGTTVSSPEEAHAGQINYVLENEEVTIIGFFSTAHKGVFTHHDRFIHLHLMTKDETKMGHLDAVEIAQMKLYLPKL